MSTFFHLFVPVLAGSLFCLASVVAVSTLVLHFRRETSHPLTFSLMAASVFYSVAAAVIMLLPQALGEVRYWLYAVSLALATLVTLTAFVLHVRYGDASKGLTWTYRAPFVLPAWLVQTTLALQALGTNHGDIQAWLFDGSKFNLESRFAEGITNTGLALGTGVAVAGNGTLAVARRTNALVFIVPNV